MMVLVVISYSQIFLPELLEAFMRAFSKCVMAPSCVIYTIINGHLFIAWLIMSNGILTLNNLQKRRIHLVNGCSLCEASLKSR